MLKYFEPFKQVDTGAMLSYVESMEEVVEALDERLIPDATTYTLEDLSSYVQSLVAAQRRKLSFVKPGCWCVISGDDGMPGDSRVDFVFRPTYAAVATLSRTLCDYPVIAVRTRRFLLTLKQGMKFATYRGLAGHGYEADRGAIEALRILSLGKVPLLLQRHPELCPPLATIIREVAESMQERLSTNSAVGVWGEDLSEGFRQAIETMRLVNDPEFMRSISEARHDRSVISRKDWKW
jgi:hypothetical protein